MQTHFTPEQRSDPDIALADDILRKCVHCGFCLATCPTYVLDGDERDSPRGRIYLMKSWLETGAGAEDTLTHLDRCLTCGSCETTCPSGVDYLALAGLTRKRLEDAGGRKAGSRLWRRLLLMLFTTEGLFRLSLGLGRITRPLHGMLPRSLRRMTSLLPPDPSGKSVSLMPAENTSGPRVILHEGCVQKDLRPEINDATERVLIRLGARVERVSGFGCCGAMADHLGEREKAIAQARANMAALQDRDFDVVVSNASGCGVLLKDYGLLFRGEPDEAAARAVADKVADVSELVDRLGLPEMARGKARIAWQGSCTLQHGQKIKTLPQDLLRRAGHEVVEPAEPHLCCGFAGTYSLLEPERSERLGVRKIAALEACGAEGIASANIGCITGLAGRTDLPVRHFIEWIGEALAENEQSEGDGEQGQ